MIVLAAGDLHRAPSQDPLFSWPPLQAQRLGQLPQPAPPLHDDSLIFEGVENTATNSADDARARRSAWFRAQAFMSSSRLGSVDWKHRVSIAAAAARSPSRQ